MARSNARTAFRPLGTGRHPIYAALLPIPIVCFVGALITDVVYSNVPDMMWLDFSTWLLLVGLIGGAFAGAVLVVDLVRAGRYRSRLLVAHALLFLTAWVLEVFNSFVHARDGWTAVVPTGLALSVAATAISLLAGWSWQSAYHHHAGFAR